MFEVSQCADVARAPSAQLVMTGKAQSIQALKAQLKTGGVSASGKNKPYGSVGKTGLD